jgi:hypothetical protein
MLPFQSIRLARFVTDGDGAGGYQEVTAMDTVGEADIAVAGTVDIVAATVAGNTRSLK